MAELFSLQSYRGKRVCVALSGGADSVCLLHFFHVRAAEFEISLSALHVEHGIRGEESLRDRRFCEELCKEWGIPLTVVRKNVPALAKAQGLGLEEAGRAVRYAAFSEALKTADCVATAHHAGDVAETVLFRLARGTALSGMKTITEHSGIVRPMIGLTRAQIEAHLAENALSFVEDATNADEAYTRNYIRHTVLPAFEKISGNAQEHLVRFASLAAQDDEFLQQLAEGEVAFFQGDYLVPAALPAPLFSRACLYAMKRLGVQKDYTGAHFGEMIALQSLQSGKKINLPGGVEAAREYENIVFYRPVPPMEERPFSPESVPLTGEGLRVDLDAFPAGCVVRSRKEGDFIIAFGGQRKTLKKFLTDKKISARTGKKLPLIACGSEIYAVVGVEISDKVKITEKTVRTGYLGQAENKSYGG